MCWEPQAPNIVQVIRNWGVGIAVDPSTLSVGKCYVTTNGQVRRITKIVGDGVNYEVRSRRGNEWSTDRLWQVCRRGRHFPRPWIALSLATGTLTFPILSETSRRGTARGFLFLLLT